MEETKRGGKNDIIFIVMYTGGCLYADNMMTRYCTSVFTELEEIKHVMTSG